MSESRLKFFFAVGRIFSPLYALAMRLRVFFYRHNLLLRRRRLPVPVVSVGNLTLGGTGKTPLVIYLAELLRRTGRRPAILSRGYGRREQRPLVVSDGLRLLADAASAGDEPMLLAVSLPEVPVLVGANRVTNGRRAVEEFKADCLLLDDGFQHLALERDLDLVLFSAHDLPFNGRVFPGGPLREPWSALGRAQALVITGVSAENRERVAEFCCFLSRLAPDLPCFRGEYLPVCLVDGHSGKTMPLAKMARRPLYGFAGIARPESFRETLRREDFLLTGFAGFADHHPYRAADYAALVAAARQRHAAGLITTEKDLVKLDAAVRATADFPLWALRVALFMEAAFDDFVARRLGGR